MKRRTEISIDIEREIVISHPATTMSWCMICGTKVQMLTAAEAAQVIKTDESVIYQLTESGKLHFATTTQGRLLICPDSLAAVRSDETLRTLHKIISEGKISSD